MSTRKRAWQRMPLLRSPSAKSLSLAQSRRPVRTGQWSRLSPGNANLVWHRSCSCLTDSPFGAPRGVLSPDSRFPPRKPPDSARSHTWCDSDTGSRRQVGNMPYLGVGSISGIIHIMARLPHAARAVVVVAVLIALCAKQRRARMTLELLNCRQRGACFVRQMQIPRCGRACARRHRR